MNAEMLDLQSATAWHVKLGAVEPYLRTARVQVDSSDIFSHNLSAFNSKFGVRRADLENQFFFLQFWMHSKDCALFSFAINGDFDEIDRVEGRVDDSSASDDGFINNLGTWPNFSDIANLRARRITRTPYCICTVLQ
jgi:hypothetical protein